ncbi:MAG TPA: carbon monoxide dehydrogenase subunit G [Candidatus Tectomicrobia bacterium]|nr:carbon monoxide dehydrogenase subunit G [Candidatus Tectomicrobia bacterium]
MKVSGTQILNAPQQRVWEMLNDPAFLKACLPGCESMEAVGPDQYQVVLTVGIAAVKGKYTGRVTLLQKEPPQRLTMQVEGKGSGGFMQGTGQLQLADDPQGTKVTYQGDVQVGGPIASVGQRLLDGAAKMIVGQFFTAVNVQLAAMAAPPSGPPPAPGPAESGPAASSLTATPVQISPWRTLLQFLATQLREKPRQWFSRSG